MIPSSRTVEGFVLVLVISVSAYLTVVQLVNGFGFDGLIESFTVNVSRRSGSDSQYAINEVFAVEVECRRASAYRLRFYHAGSLVHESYESVSASSFSAKASLVPPAFSAGNVYLAVLDVYVYNEPLLGASFSKSVSHVFEAGQTGTRLRFTGVFNGCSRELRLVANLTDIDGYPVVNETVDFGMLMSKRRHVTDDWEPLISAATNASGLADTGMALSIPSANYTVRAHHNANENFGESEHILAIPIYANETSWGFLGCQSESLLVCGSGRVVISVPSFSVYTLLKINAGVTYYSDTPSTQDGPFYAFFFRDYINSTGYVGCTRLALHLGQYPEDPWTGTGSIGWTPRILGNHKLICLVVNSTGHTIGSTDVSMYVSACPSNVVTHLPEAIYSNDTDITVAVAMPRRYNVTSTGGFVSTSLASKFAYNGGTYAIDDLAESTPVDLYVNGSWIARNFTDQEGLASFSHRLTFAGSHCRMYLRTVVNGSITLYQGWNTTQDLCFTKVNVVGSPGGIVGQFRLNSTFMNSTQVAEPIYVGVSKTVETSTQLFGLPVCDSPVSALIGKLRARYCSDSDGRVQKPNLTDFTRVVAVYNISETKATATLDFVRDGIVDLKEVIAVGKAFGAVPGDANWDWRADVVFDWKIDLKDYFAIAKYYGDQVKYLDVMDYSSIRVSLYKNGAWVGEIFADSDGCAWLPATGVTEIKLTLGGKLVGGVVEFFNKACHFDGVTNNAGEIRFSWVPEETATVDFMTQGGNLPYFLSVWLPKHFAVFTKRWDPVTEVVSALSVVRLLDVLKRSVNLTVDMPCEFHVETIEAEADATTYHDFPDTNFGNDETLALAGEGAEWEEAFSYLRFSLSAIPQNAYIISARLDLFRTDQRRGFYPPSNYAVYRVSNSWDESTVKWSNRPTRAASPSCTFGFEELCHLAEDCWVPLNVNEDVCMWLNGSAPNYGFVLENDPETSAWINFTSSEAPSQHPALEVAYISPSPVFVVNAYDTGAQKPVGSLNVSISADGAGVGNGLTNSSGMFTVSGWNPTANKVYNVTVSSPENATHMAGRTNVLLDLRFPTNVTSFAESPFSAMVGVPTAYYFFLGSSGVLGLTEQPYRAHVNGTFLNGTRWCWEEPAWKSWTWLNGYLSVVWVAPSSGTYCISVEYSGSALYQSSECMAVVNASVKPLAILFSATPNEFEAGTDILLNATVIDVATSMRIPDNCRAKVEFFKVDQNSVTSSIGWSWTDSGVALKSFHYPTGDNAYAFLAEIKPEGENIPQGVCSSPVQLTVSKTTRLILNATRGEGSQHVIWGWLRYNGFGVPSRTVKIKINETEYTNTTLANGYFSLERDLKPTDNKRTVYTVSAIFEGDEPKNATALACTMDGTRYAACTTTYFGNKPSTNTSVLLVTPQGTEVYTSIQEMYQKEAEQRGWLRARHEFTYEWPFYRIHYIIDVNGTLIDVGFSPVSDTVENLFGITGKLIGSLLKLPGGETLFLQGLEMFSEVIEECVTQFLIEAGTLMAEYVAAKAGYWAAQPKVVAGALLLELGEELYILATSWDDRNAMLTFGVANIILGLIAVKTNLAAAFLRALSSIVSAPAISALYLLMNNAITIAEPIKETTRDVIDWIQIGMTFGFAATALARCIGWT